MASPIKQRQVIEWQPIREAYLNRTPTPTFTDLSVEFNCAPNTVSTCANEEDWIGLRVARQEEKLVQAQANDVVLTAIRNEGKVLNQARDFVAQFLSAGVLMLQELVAETGTKSSTRIQSLNNLGFAAANIGRFMDSAGLIGMKKDIANQRKDSKTGDSDGWSTKLLQQINVTVQNLQSAESQAKAAENQVPAPLPVENLD